MSPLRLELPVVVPPPKRSAALQKQIAEDKAIKSINSNVETSIKFVNRSKQTIKVYWLDYEGIRQLKDTLEEGDSHGPRRTFLTHPWLITDKDGNAWYVYFPDAQPRTVDIFEPARSVGE